MAAVKMKSKSNKECSGKHSLHALPKPNKMRKGSFSQIRSDKKAAKRNTSICNSSYVSSINEVSSQNGNAGASDLREINVGDFSDCLYPSSPIFDSTRMASQADACVLMDDMIFSPTVDQSVRLFKPLTQQETGGHEETELPHLVADDSDDGTSGSTVSQTCPTADFNASESVDKTPEEELQFPDMEIADGSDYECMVADMMFDMTELMILPFLGDGNIQDELSTEEVFPNSDATSFFLPIHQMKPTDQNSATICHSLDEGAESFDPQLFFRSLPDFSETVPTLWPVLWPKETRKKKSVTLVLDLDETLVHSSLEHSDNADFTFPVLFNMKENTVYVKRRPYLQVFLEKVAEMFDVVIFTASQSIYAEQLLDILDPENKIITQRIYRESCVFTDGTYTKDLTVLGLDLAKVAIVDNSPQVFRLQVDNGIPIKSWFDDPSDCALISLLPFLETLADADDVRPIIAKRYGNKEFPVFT